EGAAGQVVERQQARCQGAECRRRVEVRRFAPSLTAADHARSDHRQTREVGEPGGAELLESLGEAALRNSEDAERRLAPVEHLSCRVEEPATQRGSTPVESNQARPGYGFGM